MSSSFLTIHMTWIISAIKRLLHKPYRKEGSFTHNGEVYDISKAFEIVRDRMILNFPVQDLVWVLDWDEVDFERLLSADTNAPIMVAEDKQGRLTVVDGLHRLSKAKRMGLTTMQGYYLSKSDLNAIKKA